MSSDRRENDGVGDQKHREMLGESRESFEKERKESVHSDGEGSSVPRNQESQNSGNSAKSMSSSDDQTKEKYRERSEEERQGSRSSEGSSLLGKRSHSERSPRDSPERTSKMSETTDERDKQSSHSSSGSRKRSHSDKSPQRSPEKKRRVSEITEADDEKREKPRERSEELRYSKKESSHSSSGSRKRSHSPSSSSERERKASDAPRFKIPKKERKDEDLRDKIDKKTDKKTDRREEERSSSEASKSSSRKERPITSSELKKEIKDLLRTEHHHLMKRGKKDDNGDIQGVEWCYKYLDPDIRGHITGGRAILHHRCRQCNRICLHLLGKYGTGKRMCLICAARERGWKEKEVPSWYFHDEAECSNCRQSRYDRPWGRSGYNSYYYSR